MWIIQPIPGWFKSEEKIVKMKSRDEIAFYKKQWYQKNKDKISQRRTKYTAVHREELNQYQKEWYKANKEKRLPYHKKYREEHREKIAQYHKAYCAVHKGEIREYQTKYRLKKKCLKPIIRRI